MHAAVRHPVVELVGDDGKVVARSHLTNGEQVFAAHHRAGGVRWIAEQDRLRPRRHGSFQIRSKQTEVVRGVGRHRHELTAGHARRRQIRHVARVRAEHFVAGVQQRAQGDVERLARPARDDDLVLRVVVDAVEPLDMRAQLLAQFKQAVVRGVVRVATLDAGDRCPANGLGGNVVRFAHAQRDHVVDRAEEVKKLADPAWRDRLHSARNETRGAL